MLEKFKEYVDSFEKEDAIKYKYNHSLRVMDLSIDIAKSLGIKNCLITADVENIVSNKTIISEGGILENTVMWNNDPLNRYWINLK